MPLAVAAANHGEPAELVRTPGVPLGWKWSRAEVRRWLSSVLSLDQPRTIVALDFGFGLPWGADQEIFGCSGWRPMVGALAELYAQHETARAVAGAINHDPRFAGHGPYRFDESRTDFRFYVQRGVAYYRLVETAIPQAISQWYFGSGGTVGFHTITGLAAVDHLLRQRDEGTVRFRVWPQECEHPTEIGDEHVIVESYPAPCPKPQSYGPCLTDDERDAWKVLQWMIEADVRGQLAEAFTLASLRFGRVTGISFWEQVRFEGWILGVC